MYVRHNTLLGWFFGVLVELSNLPVQVGVPGSQLVAVEGLNVEVRTFDLQINGSFFDDKNLIAIKKRSSWIPSSAASLQVKRLSIPKLQRWFQTEP